jgi:hypothetical protein
MVEAVANCSMSRGHNLALMIGCKAIVGLQWKMMSLENIHIPLKVVGKVVLHINPPRVCKDAFQNTMEICSTPKEFPFASTSVRSAARTGF